MNIVDPRSILVAQHLEWGTLPLTFVDDQDVDISVTSWILDDPQCTLEHYQRTSDALDEQDEVRVRSTIDILGRVAKGDSLSGEECEFLATQDITIRPIQRRFTPNTRLRYWHQFDGECETTVGDYLSPDWSYLEAIANLADRTGIAVPYGLGDMLIILDIACEGQGERSNLTYLIGGTTRVDILNN